MSLTAILKPITEEKLSFDRRRLALSLGVVLLVLDQPMAAQTPDACMRTITANVAALDAPFFLNRLGAMLPEGMVFALERDIVRNQQCREGQWCQRAQLRDGKRPRPIVLRANVGDCLSIRFTNLLSEVPRPLSGQTATRYASVHVAGMQLVSSIRDDGSFVGVNDGTPCAGNPAEKCGSLAAPGGSITYLLRATAEGTFLLNSEGAPWGGVDLPVDGAQVTAGLFGAVNVEPQGAVWLRSQITRDEMMHAVDTSKGNGFSPSGQPFLDFNSPILQMLDANNEIVASDLTAVIAGPAANGYMFPESGDPNTSIVPYEPERRRPFREFTIEYHELNNVQQAFPIFDYQRATLTNTLSAAGDAFAINYGSGGIGAEILANRFGLGPMNSCADCRFEEFFLSSWTVGDPAMVVDYPANAPCSDKSLNNLDATNPHETQVPICAPGVRGNAPKKDPSSKDPDSEKIVPIRKATKALYPDDPSNVYHSYINDRVIFRTIHAGTGLSHVHHLHAHQWFHSPNADGSTYLDSQLINPGSAYTMEIAHLGSGNLNKVVGDSIFHCHFYPHFAAGMWAHWRSHDVFELGTELDQYGKPKPGWNRAQPDGEIAAGTPIPGLVPMPGLPMAPMPARVQIVKVADPNDPAGPNDPPGPPVGYRAEVNAADLKAGLNPGYPFFIPGVGGTRAPHPPMDFATEQVKDKSGTEVTRQLDGGLPRHLLLNGRVKEERHNYLNFSKDIDQVNAFRLPEDGTPEEKAAMAYHEQCTHATFTSLGVAGAKFRTNGLPAVSGAPYADPGLTFESKPESDTCAPINEWIDYKAAVVETDFVLNKVGWHYPQSRLLTLWEDVLPTVNGQKPPEPFFIRANSGTGVNYWHTNLVPSYYLLDDYQVRTPTDIIGQHIHLVKFDVTSSDGAANGFNYEDGTLSYQEVQELIGSINECGGLAGSLSSIKKCGTATTARTKLKPEAPPSLICPDLTKKPCSGWFGAQTTVQRWYADPLSSEADGVAGERTLRTVFTHDHFGPSTHQQTGLYAALLVEPTGSSWFLNDATKTRMPSATRKDGGPTSWEAVIETPGASEKNTYREFALALQDFQYAYLPSSLAAPKDFTGEETLVNGSRVEAPGGPSWVDPTNAIEPAPKPPSQFPQPNPQIISAGPTPGTLSFNYRNEPLPYRVAGPGSFKNDDARATDLSYVFSSRVARNMAVMNSQPPPGAPIGCTSDCTSGFRFPAKPLTPGVEPGDPYTPLLRAYEGDRVQVRVIVGAHMLPHDFTIQGIKWLFEPSFANSGYRSNQSMGISEHFEFLFETPRASPSPDKAHDWSDYLYMPDASNQNHGIVDGMWGLFRAYKNPRKDLPLLPTNMDVKPLPMSSKAADYSCPPDAPLRQFWVNAESPSTPMVYNSRGVNGAGKFPLSPITNPFPLLYTYQSTTPPGGASTNVTPNSTEPLVLRANAGDCVALTLKNAMSATAGVFGQSSTAAFAQNITLSPSTSAGIAPGLLSYDVMTSSGMNIGFNPAQTVAPGSSMTYYWYAGQTRVDESGRVTGTPIEFGGLNLTPSDPIAQDNHGLVGGLVVEPRGSVACPDIFNPQTGGYPSYASVWIYEGTNCTSPGKLRHREFVMITQDDTADLTWPAACYCPVSEMGQNCAPCTTKDGKDCKPCEMAISSPPLLQTAVNYRTEPMSYRFNATKFTGLPDPKDDFTTLWRAFSDGWVFAEPQTPIFAVARNTPTRFHLLHPGGSGDQQVMALHGHVWQELPYVDDSTRIGNNTKSMWLGARDNYGTNTAYSIILDGNGGAGGRNGVVGDYLYRTTPANFLTQGLWGIMRVGRPGSDIVSLAVAQFSSGGFQVSGSSSVYVDDKANAKNGQRAETVSLSIRPAGSSGDGTPLATVNVGEGGHWTYGCCKGSPPFTGPSELVAVSPFGGRASIPITLAARPSTPPSAQPEDALGQSIRFVNTPREGDSKPIPTAKPDEGLLAPPAPVAEPAPPAKPKP